MQGSTETTCANCKRVGSDLNICKVNRELLKGKHNRQYYSIPNLTKEEKKMRRHFGPDAVNVYLCSCCVRHLLENSGNTYDANDYWPAMIYKFLSHKNSEYVEKLSFHHKWSLIPATWRHWWETEFQDSIIDAPNPVFVDVSQELQEVTEAINELKWNHLARCMDKHFAYPEVSRKQIKFHRMFHI